MAINKFTADTDKEIELVRKISIDSGADDAVMSDVWANGGEGGKELAESVVKAADKPGKFKFLYELDIPIKEKIETIATRMYGAKEVDFSPVAEKKLKQFTEMGYDNLPICMAKTHLSLSHDPKLKGRPQNYIFPVRDIMASVGAGFLYPLCGQMRTMPGLPTTPAGNNVDIDKDGKVKGLF